MLKFDKPVTTKSGEHMAKIWKELQECWAIYKKARMDSDLDAMREHATKIQTLQDDLGITTAEFPELQVKQIRS